MTQPGGLLRFWGGASSFRHQPSWQTGSDRPTPKKGTTMDQMMPAQGQMGMSPGQPATSDMRAPASTSNTATIAWQGEQVMVDVGQGPQEAEGIGEALQMILDAYKRTATPDGAGQADFLAGFGQDEPPQREPTQRDRASAQRF